MKFIQIIEYRTSDIDAVQKMDEEWEQATEGKRTARRSITTRDRNDPSRFFDIVFFDSYESAMENSNLPETRALAEKFASLLGEAPRFYDLDVVDDRSSSERRAGPQHPLARDHAGTKHDRLPSYDP